MCAAETGRWGQRPLRVCPGPTGREKWDRLDTRETVPFRHYFLNPSFRLTARLKTSAPGLESLESAQK